MKHFSKISFFFLTAFMVLCVMTGFLGHAAACVRQENDAGRSELIRTANIRDYDADAEVKDGESTGEEKKEFPLAVLVVCVAICVLLFAGTLAAVYVNKRRAANRLLAEAAKEKAKAELKPEKKESGTKTEAFLNKLLSDGTLSGPETDVLREYLSGKTREMISEKLAVPEAEVKERISDIFSKTGAKSKKDLLRMAEGEAKA